VWLANEFDVKVNVDAMQYHLAKEGWNYGKLQGRARMSLIITNRTNIKLIVVIVIGKVGSDPSKVRLRRCVFIREMAKALKLEKEGKAILVYLDESYINTHHSKDIGW
jgi:hypothetical protein